MLAKRWKISEKSRLNPELFWRILGQNAKNKAAKKRPSKQTIHPEPTFASRGETIKQEQDARNSNNYKSNIYSHNQFPFFLLFVKTNPTINAEIEITNEQM